jgi:hypothetical protein
LDAADHRDRADREARAYRPSTVPTDDSASASVVTDVPGAARVISADNAADWGDWLTGEATVTFVDLGDANGDPRAQLALYARPFELPTYAASIELTRDEATALRDRLSAWLDETGEWDAQPEDPAELEQSLYADIRAACERLIELRQNRDRTRT